MTHFLVQVRAHLYSTWIGRWMVAILLGGLLAVGGPQASKAWANDVPAACQSDSADMSSCTAALSALNASTSASTSAQPVNTSTLEARIASSSSTYISPFVGIFTSIVYGYARNGFSMVASSVYGVVRYVFMIWIIVQAIQLMLGLRSGQELVWDVITRCVAFMGISILIGAASYAPYWSGFVTKPMQTVASLSSTLMAAGGANLSTCSAESLVGSTLCLTQNMESTVAIGIKAGALMAIDQNWSGFMTDLSGIIPVMANFFGGLILIVVFGLGMVYYGFFIVDVVTKICLLSAFGPFFIGFFIVKPTRKYAINALKELLGAFVNLVSASVVLGFVASIMVYNGPVSGGSQLQGLLTQMMANAGGASATSLSIVDATYWRLLLCGFILVLTTRRVVAMIGGIIEGGHTELGGEAFFPVIQRAVIGTAVFATVGNLGGARGRMAGKIFQGQPLGPQRIRDMFQSASSTVRSVRPSARSAGSSTIIRPAAAATATATAAVTSPSTGGTTTATSSQPPTQPNLRQQNTTAPSTAISATTSATPSETPPDTPPTEASKSAKKTSASTKKRQSVGFKIGKQVSRGITQTIAEVDGEAEDLPPV